MQRIFLADLEIIILFIEIVIVWELCAYFIVNSLVKRKEKEIHGNLCLSLSSFFLCYSIYKLFYVFRTHYFEFIYVFGPFNVGVFEVVSRTALALGALIFILIMNQVFFKKIFKQDLIRRIYVGVLIGSALIFVFLYYSWSNLLFLIILVAVIFVLLSIILYFAVKWIGTVSGTIRVSLGIIVCGGIVFVGGASLSRIVGYIGLGSIRWVAYLIEIGGMAFLGFGLWSLPSLSELDWKEKILHLYIIKSGGLCVYDQIFKGSSTKDSHLVSSGITGVVNIVKDMTESDKKLSIIKQGERNIMLEYGQKVTAALLVEEDLEILRLKLRNLLIKFEEFFKDVISLRVQNLEVFRPAKVLIKNVFGE